MKRVINSLLVATAAVLAAPAHAQFAKPDDAIKYRRAAFSLMGNHIGRISAQLKAEKPNVQTIQSSAALVQTFSMLPYEAFGPGTDMGSTEAKDAVWKEPAKFKAAAEKMQAEVTKLVATAKGGDVKAIQTQFGAVGGACKACHDDFKNK
jgi:cytochrome c556